MKLLTTAIFLFIAIITTAQERFCIPAGVEPNSIQYDTARISAFLDIDKYKALFFGEQHNTFFDPEIKYHLIKHLNSNYGFRHIFMEVGIAAAWRYTQYLNTGDTSWLSNPRLVMTTGGYRGFWRRLYEYNRHLPESQRIIIHGIDFERTEVFHTLLLFSKQDEHIPTSLVAVNDTIKVHQNDTPLVIYSLRQGKLQLLNDEVPFNNTMQYIRAIFAANEADAKTYFRENYDLAKYILDNPGDAMIYPNPRNRTMALLMQNTIEQEEIKKFIGFLGNTHTDYSITTALTNFIAKQKQYSRNEILTIKEVVYNMRAPDDGFPIKVKQPVKNLFVTGCKAVIIPAAAIRTYKRDADYILITDYNNKGE